VAVFFFLLLVAIVLGIIGWVVKGLLFLFAIGVLVFLLSFVLVGWRWRRRRRPSAEDATSRPGLASRPSSTRAAARSGSAAPRIARRAGGELPTSVITGL
jgi:hypothetical protein